MTVDPDALTSAQVRALRTGAPAAAGAAVVPGQGHAMGRMLRLPVRRHLNIAMIGQRGVPATYGGIEHHVEELGSRLADRGHRVTVYCRPGYGDPSLETWRGMDLVHLPSIRTKHLETISHSTIAVRAALRDNPDVVHFHALGPGLVAPIARRFGTGAVVQTVHGLDGDRAKWGRVSRGVLHYAERLSARVPDETIVVSHALADHFRAVHDCDPTVIPNGVAPAPYEELGDLHGEHGLTPGSYLLFVGRLVPEKGVDLLLEAFRNVDTDKRLVIAGGDSFSSDYVRKVEELAARDPRVLMLGYVYGERLRALYSNTAAYVMPSLLEGQGLTLMEASSFGAPVVASDIGPLMEMVGQSTPGARLFASGDASALAIALRETIAAGPRVRQGAEALRRRILETYDWDSMADQVEEIYLRATADRAICSS